MRLTKARVERWQKDVDRAQALVERVEMEARQYRAAAKGSKLDHLTGITATARETRVGMPGKLPGGFAELSARINTMRKVMDR